MLHRRNPVAALHAGVTPSLEETVDSLQSTGEGMPEDMSKKVRHVAWNTRRSTASPLAKTLLLIMGTVFWLVQVSPAL